MLYCVWCGNELKGRQTRFCCSLCCQKWKAKHNWRRDLDRLRSDKPCLGCGETYKGTKDQQFCSHKCADSHRKREWNKTGTCLQCGEVFDISPHHAKQVFCSRKCGSDNRKIFLDIPSCIEGADRSLTQSGYVLLYAPMHKRANTRGYVYEHKVTAEQMIGRPLLENEVVHHKNRVRWDNRKENLEVMTRKAHSLLHREMERVERRKHRDGARIV